MVVGWGRAEERVESRGGDVRGNGGWGGGDGGDSAVEAAAAETTVAK